MAMIVQAYRNNETVREVTNTALHGVIFYLGGRIASAVLYNATNDPNVQYLAQMIESYSPLIASFGAARYAYTSHNYFTQTFIAPITAGLGGISLGLGISDMPQPPVRGLEDIVRSMKRIVDTPTQLGLNGTHMLGASALAFAVYNKIRRREAAHNNPVATP